LERMADHVAGVALNCFITVFEDINDCDYYPTPTPCTWTTELYVVSPGNDVTGEVLLIELWDSLTNAVPAPCDYEVDITYQLDGGGVWSKILKINQGSLITQYNLLDEIPGTAVGFTMNSVSYSCPCVTMETTNRYTLYKCSDNTPTTSWWIFPDSWSKNMNYTQPLVDICGYLERRYLMTYNNNYGNYGGYTLLNDCSECP